jgi:serine/threonine protein phosphatase PrpC
MATTLTVLVLRGRRYVCAHVGDSRLYLLRDGVCTRLTSDHVWEHPELKNVLSRAVGLDRHFQLDFLDGDCRSATASCSAPTASGSRSVTVASVPHCSPIPTRSRRRHR